MTLPKSLTTVTTLSKILAMALFIIFPFVGFYLGMKYQEKITPKTEYVSNNIEPMQDASTVLPTSMPNLIASAASVPTINPVEKANWKTYTNTKYGFSFKYP